MKVRASKTEYTDVQINPADVIDQLEHHWKSSVNRSGQDIRNERWEQEYHTSHSWDEDKGPLTQEELNVHNAFKVMRELMKKVK
jgi:hypothetical protein